MTEDKKKQCPECKKWFETLKHHKCEIRDKLKAVAFTSSEVEEIKEYAKAGNMTQSEFIRQAVFDKITGIKNPEVNKKPIYNQIDSINPDIIDKIIRNTNETNKKLNLMLEQKDILNKMNDTLLDIQKYSLKKDLSKEMQLIVELLKKNKSLKPIQIMEKTGLDEKTVFQVIDNMDIFKLTSNGRYSLR